MLPSVAFPDEDVEALYEYLDNSQGGIAEWLLPAMYKGHALNLIWLCAHWSTQLVRGSSEFYIGVARENGKLKVTQDEAYFFDEGLSVPNKDELTDPVLVRLSVCEAHKMLSEESKLGDSWILDVCLDYFAVVNPFFTVACRSPLGKETTGHLMNGFLRASFRRLETERERGPKSKLESTERALFESLSCKLWRQGRLEDEETRQLKSAVDADYAENYITSSQVVFQNPESFAAAWNLYENCMLPHHPEVHLEQQDAFLRWIETLKEKPPKAIMIARSDGDEYILDAQLADDVQNWLVNLFRRTWTNKQIKVVDERTTEP